ncbi:MAG: phosphatidylglycerol lysyltransferase domain-containing protein [Actinomycetia bacterium]|nr:phosphatidylglycerol lysyltransferase domain-containing protein [Actinomycetes bacterium]
MSLTVFDPRNTARFRQRIGRSADAIVLVAAILALAASFAPGFLTRPALAYSGVLGLAAMHHVLQRVIALLLIVAAVNLRRRKKVAWALSVILLSISLGLSFITLGGVVTLVALIVKGYALIGLLIARDYYQRPSERTTVRRAVRIALIVMGIVVINVVVGQVLLHLRYGARPLALGEILSWLGNTLIADHTGLAPRYSVFVFVMFWTSVAACLLLILRSATIERIITKDERAHARDLVMRYGQNPASYLTLEPDKQLFFGRAVEGVVAYGISGDIVVVLGDPICAAEDFVVLLSEFRNFCEEVASGCIFLSVEERDLAHYREFGYHATKCGDEARFRLADYTMAGGAAMKARQKVRRAQRAGVTVCEYKPGEQRDHAIEEGIARVSREWLAGKKSGGLVFTIGGTNLDDPLDRRYFVAQGADGAICGYNVFLPFDGGDGWLVDVTRRAQDAPPGVTELLVWEGFQTFKEEGATWGSMGLAPLSNLVDEDGKGSADERRLNQVYERFNRFYGFKDLMIAKKKYGPTDWWPQYFVYTGRRMTLQLMYAVIAIQSPVGIKGFLFPRKEAQAQRAVS